MNAPEFKTLADPLFNSIINKGEVNMNDQIICETTEEHSHPTPTAPSTTLINSSDESLGTNVPIQGVSGAVYAPMDTTPRPQAEQDNININLAVIQVTRALENLVTALRDAQPQAQPDLKDTVEQVLTQAVWFDEIVKEKIESEHDIEVLVDNQVDHRIGDAVDTWFSYNFSLDDHCDINDLVQDAVDDKLDAIVEEKIEELLEEKLRHATVTVKL